MRLMQFFLPLLIVEVVLCSVVYSPKQVHAAAEVGATVTLQCFTYNFTVLQLDCEKGTCFQWYKGSKLLTEDGRIYWSGTRFGVRMFMALADYIGYETKIWPMTSAFGTYNVFASFLTIANVTESDYGNYTCTFADASTKVELTKTPPRPGITMNKNYIGSNILVLMCNTVGANSSVWQVKNGPSVIVKDAQLLDARQFKPDNVSLLSSDSAISTLLKNNCVMSVNKVEFPLSDQHGLSALFIRYLPDCHITYRASFVSCYSSQLPTSSAVTPVTWPESSNKNTPPYLTFGEKYTFTFIYVLTGVLVLCCWVMSCLLGGYIGHGCSFIFLGFDKQGGVTGGDKTKRRKKIRTVNQ